LVKIDEYTTCRKLLVDFIIEILFLVIFEMMDGKGRTNDVTAPTTGVH